MNSKPLFKMTVLGVAAIFLAACGMITTNKVTRGHDIASGDVNQIAKGQTTETEIMKMFGPPTKVRDTEQGKEFYYEYTKAGGLRWNLLFSVGGSTVTKTLLVWLDKQGVVTDYAYKKN